MNEILSEYLDIFCVAYLDDILVFSQTLEEHRCHVQAILTRVRDTGLTLKVSKCEFHTTESKYLGYVISPKGLRMDEEKIRTIKEWKEPINVKGIQSFLGFANFYRCFIKDYSKITAPLMSLTRKEKKCVTLGLYRNRSVARIRGNQATFDNSQRNNLRSCVGVRW